MFQKMYKLLIIYADFTSVFLILDNDYTVFWIIDEWVTIYL